MRFELANPEWLMAALCFIPVIALVLWRLQRKPSLTRLSVLTDRMPKRMSPRVALRALPFAALCGGVALLLIALARPQAEDSSEERHSEGIDIVIALDVSGSMLARDLKPDRLEAAKRVAMDFIDGRPNDRIGLVVYEGDAFTQCPLTTDHNVLKTLFSEARSGFIANGTAVGMGLATAVNRLRHSEAKSKVVILLTDGVNNTGAVQPLDAAMLADRMGIRVYTIGLGTRGKALSPVGRYPDGSLHFDYVEVDLDEKTLQAISAATGGRSFRATDERKLKEIYNEIDRLEKTRFKVEHFSYKVEKYHRLALWGILLVLGSFLSEKLLFRSMT
ncbi:MAG: VWA domain-containing protein [Flavobacteriales bacterium]|nr:VWA domain-containing protein [Flavobacteriales bacterium]